MTLNPSLQALTDIHLYSHRDGEFEPNGNIQYVLLFIVIAFLIPLIACINFMNLATARSAMRAKEVGVRKVLGAHRYQLMKQFMGETVVLAGMAVIIAVLLAAVALPTVNMLSGKTLSLPFSNGLLLIALAACPFFIGMIAGSYPAVYLSAFLPVEVLKGKLKAGARGLLLRKGLVVAQFAMSIFLLISTGIIYDQLGYIRNTRPGFDKEHVMVVPIVGWIQRENTPALKERLSQFPDVVTVATTNGVPGMRLMPIMAVRPDGMSPEDHMMMATLEVDENFLDAMGIELVAGRNFSPDWGTDSTTGFLLNETAVRHLGWGAPQDAIGKRFEWIPYGGARGYVIGVVKDFHLRTFHEPIEPMVILTHAYHGYILIRIRPDHIAETIERIQQIWADVDPRFPLGYSFLDEDFDSLYRADRQVGQIFAAFAFLAIFVACLGLLGLASFTIQQRTKEIGIRKVLGSSVTGIVLMLSKEFTILVILANLAAWPTAYILMGRWLRNFAYATHLSPGLFVLGGLLALVIAWMTVGFHAVKAAQTNPAEALRYE